MKIKTKIIERSSALLDLLYWLTVFGALARQYLLLLTDSGKYMYRVLQAAKDEGLIAQKDIQIGSKRDKPVTYYCVTAKGLDVLSRSYDALPKWASWVRYLVPPKKVVVTREGTTNARAERYISIAGMSFIAALMGARTRVLSFENLGEVRKRVEKRRTASATTSALVAAVLTAQSETEQIETDHISLTQSDIVFHDGFEVKQKISETIKNQEKLIRIGRYTGYIESPAISALTFVGERKGMTWSNYFHGAEQKAYGCFKTHYSTYGHNASDVPGAIHGIMMVTNAKMFADLYLDTMHVRKKERFAEQYTSFHVFPITNQGVELLEIFMHHRYESIEQSLVKQAEESGWSSGPDKKYPSLFPLTDQEGVPVMIGVLINTVKLNRLLKLVETFGIKYRILCYGWQQDYYRRVCDADLYYILPDL